MAQQGQFVTVTIPNVGDVDFPSSMSQTQIDTAAKRLYDQHHLAKGLAPRMAEISAGPGVPIPEANMSDAERVRRSGVPPGSVANRYGSGAGGYIEDARQHVEKFLTDNAPAIFGTAGGLVTGGLAAPAGAAVGALAGVGGAAAGGATGAPPGQRKKQAEIQAAYETGGRLLTPVVARAVAPAARALSPWLERFPILREFAARSSAPSKKVVDYLTAATGPDAHAAIGRALGDVEAAMQKLSPGKRTVQSFLDAVNAAKAHMNEEYSNALGPFANKEAYPQAVMDRLQRLITPNLDKTAEGRTEKAAIKRAIIEFQRPWTLGELDSERVTTRARLNRFHKLGDVGQYTAKKASRNVAIDDAIEQGLKETLYPAADRLAGKPQGYFAEMKGRQANLIQLQEILDKRIKDLTGKTAQIAGSPRLSSENLSVSMHAGGTPRLGIYSIRNAIVPPDPLATASRRVAKAFPMDRVSALPYQVLLTTLPRAIGVATGEPAPRKNPTDAWAGTGQQ